MERVILLHGIWMRGVTLLPLARRLRAAGYAVETIDYASVLGGVEPAVRRLRLRMRAAREDVVHLVGHSLGSLVALKAAADDPATLPPGRIVCIGPPLRGSAVARSLAALPGGRWLLGRSADVLLEGLDACPRGREIGVVAGSLPLGLGAVIGALAAPHDGTVSVEETRLDGIADHRIVAASHTGLLLCAEAAALAAGFLRHGRFDAPDRAARAC